GRQEAGDSERAERAQRDCLRCGEQAVLCDGEAVADDFRGAFFRNQVALAPNVSRISSSPLISLSSAPALQASTTCVFEVWAQSTLRLPLISPLRAGAVRCVRTSLHAWSAIGRLEVMDFCSSEFPQGETQRDE